jgi:hypothetical protein
MNEPLYGAAEIRRTLSELFGVRVSESWLRRKTNGGSVAAKTKRGKGRYEYTVAPILTAGLDYQRIGRRPVYSASGFEKLREELREEIATGRRRGTYTRTN